MRHHPNLRAEKFRVELAEEGGVNGFYRIPVRGAVLLVIASDGFGWEHVSVSTRNRCPTWAEMEAVRELFWRDDETVMQLSVPRSEHINQHPFCLHWWKPTEGPEIPKPPAILVGEPQKA